MDKMASGEESLDPKFFDINESGLQHENSNPMTHSTGFAPDDLNAECDILSFDQALEQLEPLGFDKNYHISTDIPFNSGGYSTADIRGSPSLVEDDSDILNSPLATIDSEKPPSWTQIGSLPTTIATSSLPESTSSSLFNSNAYPNVMASRPDVLSMEDINIQGNPSHLPAPLPGLPRRRSRYFVSRSDGRITSAQNMDLSGLDPMQRWQESPPEDEPSSLAAIMSAMEEKPMTGGRPNRQSRRQKKTSYRYHRSKSTTSHESSASSTDSAWSSAGSSSQARTRRSSGRLAKSTPKGSKPRIFCCTFCCDRFGTRYEWVRHEKSLHLNLETWYCAPLGPSVFSPILGKEQCAFCDTLQPSWEHLSSHNYEACQDLSKELRSFHRKDHLVQHLRHVHHVQDLPTIDDWKVEMKNITSRCGFCGLDLDNWDDRASHLSKHFRQGSTMKDWEGDHGLSPAITARLKNAYPPYLLGWEAGSLIPFSATSVNTRDQYEQLMMRANAADDDLSADPTSSEPASADQTKPQLANFLEIFVRHLGSYAREQMKQGVIPTDEMFQREARKVVFDSEDAWDQTIADSPAWLSSFRRLHCDSNEKTAGIADSADPADPV